MSEEEATSMIGMFDTSAVDYQQRRYVDEALLRCTFPFSRMNPLLGLQAGTNSIRVRTSEELRDYGFMGWARYDPPMVELNPDLEPDEIGTTVLHEVAHLVDRYFLSNNQREAIIDVFFGGRDPNNAALRNLNERGWFEEQGAEYREQFGEAFAEAFVGAFSDYPPSNEIGSRYQATPLQRRRIRDIVFGMSGGWGTT